MSEYPDTRTAKHQCNGCGRFVDCEDWWIQGYCCSTCVLKKLLKYKIIKWIARRKMKQILEGQEPNE